ncbi:MAG: hypothetical protein H7A52_09815 [Akkermansiaceae bacterium]|nr:hypothetical protein [Akkermansiaceae bacterium]
MSSLDEKGRSEGRSLTDFPIRALPGLWLLLLPIFPLHADEYREPAPVLESGGVDYASIWKKATLYSDPEGPILRELSLTGRFQYDFAGVESDRGDFLGGSFRRFRVGWKAVLPADLALKSEVEFDLDDASPLYKRLTDSYLQWTPGEDWRFRLGKQAAAFTLDGATSSNELLTIERNNLSNNLWFSEIFAPGALVDWSPDAWRLSAGIFSAGGQSPEFGDFDGSASGLIKLGRDFSENLGIREALVEAHFAWQDYRPENTIAGPNDRVASLVARFEGDRWGFRSDLGVARDAPGENTLAGIVAMPFFNLTDDWQLVARFTWLESEHDNGLRLGRYENRIVEGRGDRYLESYFGLNRFLFGHQLKWQAGVQHARMTDSAADGGAYDGWGLATALRVSW